MPLRSSFAHHGLKHQSGSTIAHTLKVMSIVTGDGAHEFFMSVGTSSSDAEIITEDVTTLNVRTNSQRRYQPTALCPCSGCGSPSYRSTADPG